MTYICKAICALGVAPVFPAALAAQELTLGLGATDYTDVGTNSAAFEVEYRHSAFVERPVLSLALGANASVSGKGDLFAGGGLWARWHWDSGWFIDGSVMPGVYGKGKDGNDLGSTFEIRSLLGLGYSFGTGRTVSIAASHKSNASTADNNPGTNTYLIRYHFSF